MENDQLQDTWFFSLNQVCQVLKKMSITHCEKKRFFFIEKKSSTHALEHWNEFSTLRSLLKQNYKGESNENQVVWQMNKLLQKEKKWEIKHYLSIALKQNQSQVHIPISMCNS